MCSTCCLRKNKKICRYLWIRSASRPSTKQANTRRRKKLAGEIKKLEAGELPRDEVTQLQADLAVQKTLVETVDLIRNDGPAHTTGRAPRGRPKTTSASGLTPPTTPLFRLHLHTLNLHALHRCNYEYRFDRVCSCARDRQESLPQFDQNFGGSVQKGSYGYSCVFKNKL